MKRIQGVAVAVALLSGTIAFAQASPAEDPAGVPLTSERHHHLVFSNAEVQAFYVVIQPQDRTLIHQHPVDYLWVGLGDGKVVNTTVNGPVRHLTSKDAALHFTRGPLAHFARNEGDAIYRNVTIELLKKQDNPRNLCNQVLEEKPAACTEATRGEFAPGDNVTVRPAFETDQIRFNLLTIGPSGETTIRGSQVSPVVVALADTTADATELMPGGDLASRYFKDGNVMAAAPGNQLKLKNTGSGDARFLVLEFKN